MPSWVKKYPNYSGWNDGNKCAKVFKVVVSDSNLLNGDIIEGSTKLEGNGVPQTYAEAKVSVNGDTTASIVVTFTSGFPKSLILN